MDEVLTTATLQAPADSRYIPSGRVGIHSEHMGHMLTEMQYLQRAYPNGVW
jgi:ring-1,2-phenylacetyl-CoA epoxidase subunit PaaC